MLPALLRPRGLLFRHAVLVGALLGHGQVVSQPFTVQGPVVDTNNFRITTFAGGLNFPLGMAWLADDSLLVTISDGPDLFNSAGRLVRFTDSAGNGVADGAGTVLYSNLPGTLTSVRVMDNLVFAV